MNRGQFRSLVESYVKYSGNQYISDAVDLNTLCNERLRAFSAETLCLYDDAITLTLTANTATYNFRDLSIVSKELVLPTHVVIDAYPLYNYQMRRGFASLDEVATYSPNYLTAGAAKPNRAILLPGNTLRLVAKPDQVYTNCYLPGFYFHPTISTLPSGDATSISIPEEFQRVAAIYTAIDLLLPTSTAQSDYEKIAVFDKRAAQQMMELKSRSASFFDGPGLRGMNREHPGLYL